LQLRYKADVDEEAEGYAMLPSDENDSKGEETV